MNRFIWAMVVAAVVLAGLLGVAGCLQVQAPKEINVGTGRGHEPIDTSRVPPTQSHEEARQKLAEAYDRISYLEGKVRGLEKDKRELKSDLEECKDKMKRQRKNDD